MDTVAARRERFSRARPRSCLVEVRTLVAEALGSTMLSAVDPRKRPPAGSDLVRGQVRTPPRPSSLPRRVWRLSDPSALARLTGRIGRPTPTPVPWIESDENVVRHLPDLIANVPSDSGEHDDLMSTRELPVTRVSPTPIQAAPARRADMRERFEAVPDLNRLVQTEMEARARLQLEVEAALQQAVAKLRPEMGSKPTSPFAWLLLGLSLGGMLVFFMLGSNGHATPQPMTIAAPPATQAAPPPVCVAPEIAPAPATSPASFDSAAIPAIPTFAVDALPKPKAKAVWVAPKRKAPATVASATIDTSKIEADSDNPYDDVKDEAASP